MLIFYQFLANLQLNFRGMKIFLILLCCFVYSQIYTLNNDILRDSIHKKKPEIGIEFFAIPALYYNNLNLGISFKKKKSFEQVFKINSTYSRFISEKFNYNVNSSSNFYFRNSKNYIPLWARASNTRRDVDYEEGYNPHTLRFTLGSGFGRVSTIGKKMQFRTELGIGYSLNLTNSKGNVFPVLFNYSDYKFDAHYPQYNSKFLPSIRLNFAFVFRK